MPSDQLALPGNDTLYVLCVYASKQRPTSQLQWVSWQNWSIQDQQGIAVIFLFSNAQLSNRLELVQTVRYGTDSVQASSRSMDKLVPQVIW